MFLYFTTASMQENGKVEFHGSMAIRADLVQGFHEVIDKYDIVKDDVVSLIMPDGKCLVKGTFDEIKSLLEEAQLK